MDHRGWLIEGWRSDDKLFKPCRCNCEPKCDTEFSLKKQFRPEMLYLSYSKPNVRRGAHLHTTQQDYFIFLGPSNFRVVVKDNRSDSPTYNNVADFCVGENKPTAVLIPTNCWHGYENIGNAMGAVINIPDVLYKGENYSEPVDEVRKPWDELYTWPEIQD